MDKTIATYTGDERLFETALQSLIESELPQEMIEWKRSYGRASKNVVIHPKFVKFDYEQVVASCSVKSLLGQPILHTYWVECSEMDTYKSNTKDEIMNWITTLKKCGAPHDWMVILVETPESRRSTNKLLPRTSVVDKLRTDVGSKYAERCITLMDPSKIKTESRASESWQTLLHRLRLLLLQAYNRTLMKFEENMRSQREKRNDANWNFCEYFLLQEELAFVYEMLGVCDEALVQYDELDALFTQFILNCNVTESPQWLEALCLNFTDWTGLSLNADENLKLRRDIITEKSPSFLSIRNYLFARQSLLLFQMNRPWEVAKRCLSFLHNGAQEFHILDINCPPGSVACWVLLSALKVLKTCQEFSMKSTAQVQNYCLHTAELWSYCREKMLQLGELCGLLPNCQPSSQQLHFVVELSSGIRDGTETAKDNPVDKLKEALSSKSAFEKYYLELAESAISTYKHIGRIRSARMVGLELAKFYLEMGQVQKANNFLVDALKTFENEGWSLLKIQTLTDTAKCYEKLNDYEKLVRTCAQMACAKELVTADDKLSFCQKMIEHTNTNLDKPTLVDAEELLSIKSINLESKTCQELSKVTPGSEVVLVMQVESHFPMALPLSNICTSLTFTEPQLAMQDASEKKIRQRKSGRPTPLKSVQRSPSNRSTTSTASSMTSLDPILDEDCDVTQDWGDTINDADENRLEFYEHFDYKQDKSLSAIRLVCRNATKVLKRKDSSGSILKDGSVKKSDFTHKLTMLESTKPELKPGLNEFTLALKASCNVGSFSLNQLSLELLNGKLDLLTDKWPRKLKFSVITEPHSFSVSTEHCTATGGSSGNLWAGFSQEIELNIFTGSHTLLEDAKIGLRGSLGLKIGLKGQSELTSGPIWVDVPQAKPFETVTVKLTVRAEMTSSKDGLMLEHRLMIEDPWQSGKESLVPLYFRPPFITVSKMQTALTKKFLQVCLQANYDNLPVFQVKNPSVKCDQASVSFRLINPPNEVLTLKKQSQSSFIWEILDDDGMPDDLKVQINLFYGWKQAESQASASFEDSPLETNFEFKDFKTQYLLRYRIEPAKGGELCRASSICSLSITLEQLGQTCHTSLMYEVLADQAIWAICGRAAGVIDMEAAGCKQTFVVEVMPLTGGHLALPKVRLSKYILPENANELSATSSIHSSDSASNMPRLEPFSSGQVYNLTRTARIHVLPSPNAATASSSSSSSMTGYHSIASNQEPRSQQHMSLPTVY